MKKLVGQAFLPVVLLLLLFAPLNLLAQDKGPAPAPADLAAKVVIIAGGVLTILQGAKRTLDQLRPDLISGKVAIALNVILSGVGAVALADPGTTTLQLVSIAITAALAAAGG
ncbi:MAG: hypothetical protein L0099_01000, partial [Acidobacteria bacterium]|nr:hypothetical protein [Acidobacteriota bacterium]